MVNYGNFEIIMDDVVNEAFSEFSFDQDGNLGVEELICLLVGYGLVELGYLKLQDLPCEQDDLIE